MFGLGYRIIVLLVIVVSWSRVELSGRIIRKSADTLSNNLGVIQGASGYEIRRLCLEKSMGKFFVSGNMIIGFQLTTRWRFLQVTMLWSAAAMVDAQLYVVNGTIAQWYFSIDS
ncbi:hypothetical protein Hanom_Chr06g00503371 [Helianthus anomalus]